jgi:hypothetical protein
MNLDRKDNALNGDVYDPFYKSNVIKMKVLKRSNIETRLRTTSANAYYE